jgi:aryl-alcohol dehydrogenase-like predicted oxidoreductase
MMKRRLGRSDIAVAPWCFGGSVFGWTADRDASFALLDAFVGAGFDFIDTADVYSRWVPGHVGGESETVIGDWLASRGGRDRIVLATKVGMGQPDRAGRLDRAHIESSIDGSLKRLRVDYVDLYQSHADDGDTPIEETLDAYARLVKAGKVRIIGASNFSADRLRTSLAISEARGLPRYETLQPEYNLSVRSGFEGAVQDLCVAEAVSVIPYFALASGFLTGKYRSEADFGKSTRGGNMGRHLNPRGLRILGALDAVSARRGASLAAVALAWLMAQPSVAAPIASATSLDQFRDLAAAASLDLSADDRAELAAASAPA